jgi:hypothetical protein
VFASLFSRTKEGWARPENNISITQLERKRRSGEEQLWRGSDTKKNEEEGLPSSSHQSKLSGFF